MADETDISSDVTRTYKFFYGFLVLGLIFVVFGSWSSHPFIALLWSFACLACGGFVGFLFGIPKVLQGDVPPPAAKTEGGASASGAKTGSSTAATDSQQQSGYRIRANTNLEQISDWLTKIIVGITLIQLQKVPDNLNRAATFIAYSVGGDRSFAGGILIFFSVGGFLGGYLLTRLFLTRAFYKADQPELDITESARKGLESYRPTLQGEEEQKLSKDAAQGAEKLLDKSLDEVNSLSDIKLWAKAQLIAGKHSEAIEGYNKAIALAPNDPGLRLEKAIAAWKANMPLNLSKQMLLDAYSRLTPQTDKQTKANLYNSLTYAFLYLPPPEGFKGAIQYGEEYVADRTNIQDGAIYVNLAAAYGQKYLWYKNHPDPSVNLEDVRQRALDAVKSALSINRNWLERLRMLWNPNYPDKDPKENDLEVFFNDADFKAVLGAQPAGANPAAPKTDETKTDAPSNQQP